MQKREYLDTAQRLWGIRLAYVSFRTRIGDRSCWDVLLNLHFPVGAAICKSVGEGRRFCAADGSVLRRGFGRASLRKTRAASHDHARPPSLNRFVSKPTEIMSWCVCVRVCIRP